MSEAGDVVDRYEEAVRRIDAVNAGDPRWIECGGERVPYELFYSHRVVGWVERLSPGASEALRLAARSQHICRWESPRSGYPMDRAGYLKWRADLKQLHARKSGEILAAAGYGEELIDRVRALNLKQGLGRDAEVQVLEDALCLVTLQFQLADLMRKTEREKLVSILQKTWRKMSELGREAALGLEYSEEEKELLGEVLGKER
ncbi:MAG: hypothetical protein RI897_1467 [Verrucomicrobiota bacterium]